MRVVLDSNILFSALISPHAAPHRIYEAWMEGRFQLVTCREQLDEIRKASRYAKFRPILQPHRIGTLINQLEQTAMIELPHIRHEADDPGDAYLLTLAEDARAQYLVTGDKRSGLLRKRRIGQTVILAAKIFVEKIL